MILPTNPVLLIAALTLATAAAASAQNRLFVPSQYSEIAVAVQAATPGTIIEVDYRLLPYLPFVIDREVTIVGHQGGSQQAPQVAPPAGTIGIDIVLQPGEGATIAMLDVRPLQGTAMTPGIRIQGGRVNLEDCRVTGISDPTGSGDLVGVEVLDAELCLAFCRLEGGQSGVGLRAHNSIVSATKTRLYGGGIVPRDAAQLIDSTLHGDDLWLRAGDGYASGPGCHGLHLAGASRAFLVSSTVEGGTGTPGATAIENTTAVPVELRDTIPLGGDNWGQPTSAPGSAGPVLQNADLVGLRWSEPPYRRGTLQPGRNWSMAATAMPNTLCVIGLSLRSTTTSTLFTRQPAMFLGEVQLLVPVVTSASGYAGYSSSLPNVATLHGTTLWAQAVVWGSFPLEVSPVSAVVAR